MNEFKHTPGPWFFNNTYNVGPEVQTGATRIAHLGERVAYGTLCSKEEAIANAKLIAAAPDLLEALYFIVHCTPEPGEDAVLNVEGYNKACKAIQKAIKL